MVIPAFNAEATLGVTLDALQAQTHGGWEAVVVDDGSTDATAVVAAERARADSRIRLVRQANGGVSAARNAGIAEARASWLAFLDADDWWTEDALARLLDELRARPELDAVHCGWTRIAPDGREVDEICPRGDEDMFGWHAHNCAFAIHAVVVRRALVQRAGGFDSSLVTCEDWDFWVRVSRLGARWGRVDAQLARYRMRRASASMDADRLLNDGLAVVDRAHGPDVRLDGAAQRHPGGADPAQRTRARLGHAVYAAALALGQGRDAVGMLAPLDGASCPDLDPEQVAYALFEGVPLGAATIPADWPSLGTDLIVRVARFVAEVERISGADRLADRAKRMLERLVAVAGGTPIFGRLETVDIDLERPVADVAVAPDTDRLIVRARYGGAPFGPLELPAAEGSVPGGLIADAVADEHAWRILGAFLEADVYPSLDVRVDDGRLVVARAGAVLVDEPLDPGEPVDRGVHDHTGWVVLLQEIFGDRLAGNDAFYDEAHDDAVAPVGVVEPDDGWVAIELAEPLPELAAAAPVLVAATVGGATLDAIEVAPERGRVSTGALRRSICTAAGYELCRLAVREGVLGRPRDDGTPLRDRLREAAAIRPSNGRVAADASRDARLAPAWAAVAAAALGGADGYVIARRRGATTGLAGSRRALLPRDAAADAVDAARAAGDLVIAVGSPAPDAPVVYAPDVVWRSDEPAGPRSNGAAPADTPHGLGRQYFETLFASGEDPWRYASPYEQGKYEQTLALIGDERPARALELACAEGHFTRQLAPLVGHLVACDVSEVALRRARARCADTANVEFRFHDLFNDPIDGAYDLIVCSEVLYYAGDRAGLDHAVRAIAGALAPHGRLLSAHANLVVDDPASPGFDWEVPFGARVIGEAYAAAGLELVEERSNPMYRIGAWRRRRRLRRRAKPVRAEAPLPDKLPPEVEARFRRDGGRPLHDPDGIAPVTWELPILMYHRVAPHGLERLREWRVTPDQLEAQLHFLRTAGYSGTTLDEWHRAAERHQPLPGRRVLLTFDDGYEDFAEHAHPLLRAYGFDATVFLVSDRVGETNAWDRGYGEPVALMDWDTVRALDGDGVEFGGHTATHPMLTALGLADVMREAARCRATLTAELGRPVRAFSYPYGDMDSAVARTVGAAGFEFGATVAGHHASASAPMLALPRINVPGTASFEAFVRSLSPSSRG